MGPLLCMTFLFLFFGPLSHFSFPFFTKGFFGFKFSQEVDNYDGMNARASRRLVLSPHIHILIFSLPFFKLRCE